MIKRLGLVGWNLSLTGKDLFSRSDIEKAKIITSKQLSDCIFDEKTEQLHPDAVNPIPEIIAEVVGYAHSQLRKNGMFLMIDIGAGTIDVSTFILSGKNDEDLYSILFAEVKRLGAYILHRYRIDVAKKIVEKKLQCIDKACDGISPLPDEKDYLLSIDGTNKEVFNKANVHFLSKCSVFLRSVLKETKNHRNPLALEWERTLPVFLCGGGSKIQLFKSMIQHAEKSLQTAGFKGFDLKVLPKPDNFEGDDIPPTDYHRLAVSYGLSHSEIDLGQIIPQRDIKDFEYKPRELDVDKLYIDKDMV
jgi:hypothetical protein